MKIKDSEGWVLYQENNQDGYGKGILSFAERWANLMEPRIEAGEALEDIARTTSNEADTEGITGFMYGAAVITLSHVWEYGEELRRWHNLDTQLGSEGERANEEGGVLNPALMTIGE